MCEFISGLSILFHRSIFLHLCQYHSVWMTIALKNSINSGRLIPPAPFFLNNSGENGHTCLVPDLKRECSQFFTTENNVGCGFIIYSLYYVEVVSFYAHFIINECWILSKAFSASIEIIIWFSSFNLLIWCITLIDLGTLKNPCIPGVNLIWSMCMISLMCYWILFARILLRIFTSMFISDIGL